MLRFGCCHAVRAVYSGCAATWRQTACRIENGIEFSGIAHRAIRAFRNAPISLVIITPPAFTLVIITASSPETVGALIIFVKARLSYFFTHLLGIPLVRRWLWWVGLLCTFSLRNRFDSLLTVSIRIGS